MGSPGRGAPSMTTATASTPSAVTTTATTVAAAVVPTELRVEATFPPHVFVHASDWRLRALPACDGRKRGEPARYRRPMAPDPASSLAGWSPAPVETTARIDPWP